MLRRLGCMADSRGEAPAVGVSDVVQISEKNAVEQASLADLGDVLIKLRTAPVVSSLCRFWVPPHGETVIAWSVNQELCEMYFLLCHIRTLASPTDIATAPAGLTFKA